MRPRRGHADSPEEPTDRVDTTVTAALRRLDSTLLVRGFGAHVARLHDAKVFAKNMNWQLS